MPPPKECPPGKIVNPATGRCVKIDGTIGKKLAAAAAAPEAKKPKKKTPEPKKPKKKTPEPKKPTPDEKTLILATLKNKCHNDYEPISMENFSDMTIEQLKSLVYIGSKKDKKNCYLVENIYEVYKTAIINSKLKQAKDPMNPNHLLTSAEIENIKNKMRVHFPNLELIKPYQEQYNLAINRSFYQQTYLEILIYNNKSKLLGVIPGDVTINETNNAEYTSAELVSNLKKLWNSGKFMRSLTSCCTVKLHKTFEYWQTNKIAKFIQICDQVNSQLNAV